MITVKLTPDDIYVLLDALDSHADVSDASDQQLEEIDEIGQKLIDALNAGVV